ncbi:MAG TPA: UDP-N-acetylmuramate dehydrogenase [Acidobacteriaceae bacterium]|nr:UDP-N-acetylmuramate dehydrogenase [Acidobacteriaceae bacterium]
MEIQKNVVLAGYTTLGIGGPARYFAEAHTEEEILYAVEFARTRNLPLFVLGGGSNLLVADDGFPGLVLHIANRGLQTQTDGQHVIFTAAAGEEWDNLVATAVAKQCAGIECLSGIPGSVGGTPVQNVGAYGQEVSSTIVRVRALDRATLQFVEFDNAGCKFGYRSSLFNTTARQKFVVTEVTYRLVHGGRPNFSYKDVTQWFQWKSESPTLATVREAVRSIRHQKGNLLIAGDPDCRSAGSFFKNPVISAAHYAWIEEENEDIPHYPAGAGFFKIPAAWLIEQSGFKKGTKLGAAAVSSRHTLALINCGGAKAADILALRDQIRTHVATKFRIELEQEPVYLSGDSI